jgi:hypothetical protein
MKEPGTNRQFSGWLFDAKKIENRDYIDLIVSDLNFDNLHGYQLWYPNRGLVQFLITVTQQH